MEDRLEVADGADLDALAARELLVVGLAAPVVAAAGRLGGAGQRGADHDGVGAAGQGLGDVAAAGHAAVGDDVHVTAAGLVEVVAAGRGDVADGAGHGDGHAQDGAGGVAGAAAEADEDTGGTGAHQVQGGGVGAGAADDDGHVELVDEALEVERLGRRGDVLGGDGGAADDEQVHTGLDDGAPVLLRALWGELARHGDAAGADLLEPLGDELGDDRLGVDLLHAPGDVAPVELRDLLEERLGVLVAGPQTLEVEDADAAELAQADRGGRAHHRVHRCGEHRGVDVVRVDLPADRDVLRVACAPGGHDGDVVEGVGPPPPLAPADLDLVAHRRQVTRRSIDCCPWSVTPTRPAVRSSRGRAPAPPASRSSPVPVRRHRLRRGPVSGCSHSRRSRWASRGRCARARGPSSCSPG